MQAPPLENGHRLTPDNKKRQVLVLPIDTLGGPSCSQRTMIYIEQSRIQAYNKIWPIYTIAS